MTNSVRLQEFDLWGPGYGFASVTVYIGGTTTPADIYTDQALTQAADNPQTLIQQTFGGISYGKWAQPLYTGQPYELQINSVDETGVVGVPLTTLDGQDASLATVVPTNGSVASNLDDIIARTINVLDYGAFLAVGASGASATTNTNSLVAAIGQCGSNGGGTVVIPDGTFQVTQFTLPANVVVEGQGQAATILQSTQGGTVVTVSGSLGGFRHICLDGVSQVTNSIGIYALNIDQIILDDVMVKRFSTGIELIGGTGNDWKDVSLNDCQTGYAGYGSSNTQGGATGGGAALEFNRWRGGIVEFCTTVGIFIECLDELCDHQWFSDIQFDSNTGVAFEISGARATVIDKCSFNGNTTDLQVADGSPLNAAVTNTVIGLDITDCSFVGTGSTGSAFNLSGTLDHVAFRRCEFTLETITLSAPQHNVLEQDCRQISGVTFAGTATAWIVSKTYEEGKTIGLTTGNAATPAWSMTLQSGQRVFLEARVVARERNGTSHGFFYYSTAAWCSGATMDVDNVTASFTAGDVITGQTSGATARSTANSISGGSGTLTLQDINGTFQNNEIVTDTGGGSATVNGSITQGSATVENASSSIYSYNPASFTVAFAASGQQIILNVTGLSSTNIEWFADVKVTSSQQIE